jgi:CheY-like chemotaxis protein
MKKIALIEDRNKRQNHFLTQIDIDLEQYENILENFVEDKAAILLEKIANNSFNLSDFNIIACHKSVENSTIILSNLQNYCKTHDKTLVLFSGGISVNYYYNNEFELLELNSKNFYSENLKFFLEAIKNQNENILMLCYGNNWKINVVSNILEKTNYLIEQIEESIIFYNEFADFIDIDKLSKINHVFYNLVIQNNKTTIDEIKKFRDSLINFFNISNKMTLNKITQNILIHYDNVIDSEFQVNIKFNGEDIDKYISNYINKELQNREFDKIFIKDNLSSNYLELYGLRVAYHIRLSSELENKRFAPIVIISDFDEATLNRFSQDANILFTEGVYLCKNTKEDIKKYQSLELKSVKDYDKFIEYIEVFPPKDTSGSHNIANKWAIYRWAKFLDVKSNAIDKNKSEIESELYFKYLKAKYFKDMNNDLEIIKPAKKGNVLLIDDEWSKGWSDVLKNALQKDGLEFNTFEYDFKDKSNFNLIVQLNHKKLKEQIEKSEVVVLDLRLLESDHENEDIDSHTGIKILQKIHEINAGIQVIMLTATSKSTILEKLYEKKILGYIKKEHPEDKSTDTVENINKFINLVNKGLKRKYLKEVFHIQKSIKDILSNDVFVQYNLDLNFYEPFWIKLEKESTNIFEILDNESENSFIYAMVSISSSLETILSIFLNEQNMTFWDTEPYDCQYNALRCRISILFEKLGSNQDFDMKKLIDKRNDYLHSRKDITVNQHEIVHWFSKLLKMIEIIENPPKLRKYEEEYLVNLKEKFNN